MLLKTPSNSALSLVMVFVVLFGWSSVRSLSYLKSTRAAWRAQLETSESLVAELTRKNQDLHDALQEATKNAAVEQANAISTVTSNVGSASSEFAYVFYTTSDPYACGTLINIHRLRELNSTIPVHVLATAEVNGYMIDAFRAANATVHFRETPAEVFDVPYYKDCLLKLRAFEMHKIVPGLKRVLIFDSDQIIMQNLDHLFYGLPAVDLAAPRAYWLSKDFISSTFLLISLSDRLWGVMDEALANVPTDSPKFDMDIVCCTPAPPRLTTTLTFEQINDLFGDTVLMLGGEYIGLNSHWEDWNLPPWHHPRTSINMTAVDAVNARAKAKAKAEAEAKAQAEADAEAEAKEKKLAELMAHANTKRDQHGVTNPRDIASATSNSTLPTNNTSAPEPRFPLSHPLAVELTRLLDSAAIIHYFAVGKPWMESAQSIANLRPDAHPLLGELFDLWRDTAMKVCPSHYLNTLEG